MRGKREEGRAYLDGVLAVVDVGEGDFADARPAVRLREMRLDAVSLQRTTPSESERDLVLGDGCARAKAEDGSS